MAFIRIDIKGTLITGIVILNKKCCFVLFVNYYARHSIKIYRENAMKVKITALKQTTYSDLIAAYELPQEYPCSVNVGQTVCANPLGKRLCPLYANCLRAADGFTAIGCVIRVPQWSAAMMDFVLFRF